MKWLIMVSIALALAGWNYLTYRNMQSPEAAAVERAVKEHEAKTPNATGTEAQAALELPWDLMERIAVSVKGGKTVFPAELKAMDGKYVHVPGVLTPLDALKTNNAYSGGVLQPPSRISCCGLKCDPRTQLLIFVDCSSRPFTGSAARTLVSVTGKLELLPDPGGWGCASLTDIQITPLPAH